MVDEYSHGRGPGEEEPGFGQGPVHISRLLGPALVDLLRPDTDRDPLLPVRDLYDELTVTEIREQLTHLREKVEMGEATGIDRVAIDDLSIALRARGDQADTSES